MSKEALSALIKQLEKLPQAVEEARKGLLAEVAINVVRYVVGSPTVRHSPVWSGEFLGNWTIGTEPVAAWREARPRAVLPLSTGAANSLLEATQAKLKQVVLATVATSNRVVISNATIYGYWWNQPTLRARLRAVNAAAVTVAEIKQFVRVDLVAAIKQRWTTGQPLQLTAIGDAYNDERSLAVHRWLAATRAAVK
jgi:hypothetical protein